MFRVPADPASPTFDETFRVGFGRWLASSASDRHEWMRRRNAAAKLAGRNQRQGIAERFPGPELPQEHHEAQRQAPRAAPVDPTMRTLGRLARVELWLASIQLVALLLPLAIVLVIVVALLWFVVF
ncbi:hypothetical protein [Actinoplanes sp. GCM10030250]|uniref:hypothetical protein n=1 Tax=Actinoplanes sp. GCM10030250 TaxID=3273376 RepID=UPI0036073D52